MLNWCLVWVATYSGLRCLAGWSKQTLQNIKAMAADNVAAVTAEQGDVLKGHAADLADQTCASGTVS